MMKVTKFDEFVKSQKAPVIVIPANAGVTALETFYETIKFGVPKVKECFAHFL